jgi:hypothetical protein
MEETTVQTFQKTGRRRVNKKRDKDELEPYNWIDVLIRFAQISATFAGFCITFIVLVLGAKLADIGIYPNGVTYGQISVLLFGISASLFIFSSQRFLHAQEYNLWKLPTDYKKSIEKDRGPLTNDQWEDLLLKSEGRCRLYEKEGRYAYDGASFMMIFGLFWAVASYKLTIAILLFVMGVASEALQILR